EPPQLPRERPRQLLGAVELLLGLPRDDVRDDGLRSLPPAVLELDAHDAPAADVDARYPPPEHHLARVRPDRGSGSVGGPLDALTPSACSGDRRAFSSRNGSIPAGSVTRRPGNCTPYSWVLLTKLTRSRIPSSSRYTSSNSPLLPCDV